MELAARISRRMSDLELSQSELGRRAGVSQATIAALATGRQHGSKHLHKIARELDTTPAYLAGETDDPHSDTPTAPLIDSETRELNDHFADLSPADRRALLQIARSMSGGAGAADTVHTPKTKFKGKAE